MQPLFSPPRWDPPGVGFRHAIVPFFAPLLTIRRTTSPPPLAR